MPTGILKLNNLTSEINKRIIVSPNEVIQITKKEIYDFIYVESTSFFSRFGISTSFLEQHPSMWDENVDFQKGLEIVNTFRVTNDTAETGVKLMDEYNKVLTKNEVKKQYVLQVVEDYRRKYPNSLNNKKFSHAWRRVENKISGESTTSQKFIEL
ncbi:Uncharacterized protein FWK35_00010968 [Aphis craccivora]|uniref:Uncharacterized protein n=1 Tax=Aphis craccivora TaxID=307492 RepID=A0A6G0YMI4_APHCR|nr:Uncharacterized protein FWK35_00010968 [Aphis craccivora]